MLSFFRTAQETLLMTNDPRGNVLDILAAITATNDALQDAYDDQHALTESDPPARLTGTPESRHIARQIRAAQDQVRQGYKRAELNALVYIGDRLDALVSTLDAQRLTPDEVDRIIASGEHL